MAIYIIKKCKDCDKEFLGHIAKKRCDECHAAKFNTEPAYTRFCKLKSCRKQFDTNRKNQLFHREKCRQQYHSEEYYRRKPEND